MLLPNSFAADRCFVVGSLQATKEGSYGNKGGPCAGRHKKEGSACVCLAVWEDPRQRDKDRRILLSCVFSRTARPYRQISPPCRLRCARNEAKAGPMKSVICFKAKSVGSSPAATLHSTSSNRCLKLASIAGSPAMLASGRAAKNQNATEDVSRTNGSGPVSEASGSPAPDFQNSSFCHAWYCKHCKGSRRNS